MKKCIFAMCLITSAHVAHAGATASVNTTSGIVTPDIAAGFRAYTYISYTSNGDMVVCPSAPESRNVCEEGWRLLRDAVPKGRTYIGFRYANSAYGHRELEIYYK